MITFRRLHLRDVIYFREASLDLDRNGITAITGLNLNAKRAERRNGAGKSLLVAGLPHLFHGSPIGLPTSLARHSLLHNPNSSITLELNDGEHDWAVTKAKAGKSSIKWSIERDGIDMAPRTATLAEEMVAGLLPAGADEFFSTVFLDSRRASTLLTGTPAARQSHLADLFQLDGYDAARRWFMDRLRGLKDKEASRHALLDSIKDMARPNSIELAKAKARLKLLKGKAAAAEDRLLKAQQANAKREVLDKLNELSGPAAEYSSAKLKRARAGLDAIDALERWKENDRRRTAAKAILDKAGEPDIGSLRARLDALDALIKHLKGHVGGGAAVCGHCGSELPPEQAAARLDDAEKERKVKGKAFKKAEPLLRGLPPDGPKPKAPKASKEKLKEIVKRQVKCRRARDALRGLPDVGADDLPDAVDLAPAKAELAKLRGQIGELSDWIARAAESNANARGIEARLKEIDKALTDKPVLDVLADAYGPKGLRLLALKGAAEVLTGNLNRLSGILFPDNMEFHINVDVNQMDITAVRSDGRASDVRHLSGAESRMFSLIWMAAMLPMIPDNRRCNLVVLDEFEANLDEATRQILLKEYLPMLTSIVPHVIFVTPNEISPSSKRRVLQVEKRGDTSTVREL